MPDVLLAGLDLPGLLALIAISGLAGIIYGYAGFGSALIFMPLATVFVAPPLAVGAFALSALASAVTILPEAWRKAERPAVLTILAAATIAAFPGVFILREAATDALNWAVSGVVLATLFALIAGLRYTSRPGRLSWLGVGAGVGFLGGSTGLNGPMVVLFQLGGQDAPERSRANTIVVLTCSSFIFLPVMAVMGALPANAIPLGLVLLLPYAIGTRLGRALFNPEHAGLYRSIAYIVIGAAAILGLPIWT
ncbi:sulfite exporter TauE/SafE family protein [Tropicimonas sp. S265A]|uniref:sulfite exporter TauE/SafE family protein n=1 Tax=Tropicimonas sp. S265A TaxID=3415134 RepID=UPI003C79F239